MFFEHYNISTEKSIAITGLLSNITTRPDSHKGGWARLLKCQLVNLGYSNVKIIDNKDSILDFDVVIFDLGAEFSGALNMFGGLDEKVFKRLTELKNFSGDLFSWRNELPSILTLSGRRSNASSCEAFKQTPETFLSEVQEVLNKTKVFEHAYLTKKVLIGDSHTPSVWTPDFMIERRDGRSLKGMLEHKTIHKIVNTNFRFHGMDIDTVHVHCGSIDIRHHVMREPNGFEYTFKLASELLNQLMNIDDAHLIVTHTMGIEDESRELPKTGYYKGTPFYGSWHDRNLCRITFNSVMNDFRKLDSDVEVVKLPEYFFDENGKLRFEVMEKPQSVHTSPEHYRWDLDQNKLRWTKEHDIKKQTEFAVKNISADLEKVMYGKRRDTTSND